MKLIVNADDYGYSKAVNLGIIEGFKTGIVKSTTMMTGMPAFSHAVDLAKENKGLGVGIHLTMTMGYPVLQGLKTITAPDGKFLKQVDFYNALDTIDLDEIRREFTAQIEKALDAGIEITHLDSHHHVHAYNPITGIFCDLAKKFGVPVRNFKNTKEEFVGRKFTLMQESYRDLGLKTTDEFTAEFYGDTATFETFERLINNCKGDSLEIMCHPAYMDLALYAGTGYSIKRMYELDVLTSDAVKNFIQEKNVEVTNFRNL